jgi:hypothetical protein
MVRLCRIVAHHSEQDEDVTKAALPPSEAHCEGALDSDFEEGSDIEYSNEEVYCSEDNFELDEAVALCHLLQSRIRLT